ncbi:MAG: hypothetical protein HQM00_13330, partial [Magnetococcales bacterium]|nr:hypothetical protein [Magnetococcales bacterium]
WSWFYYARFSRLWREFAVSLRAEAWVDPITGVTRNRLISAIPPELVFNQQSLVDVPMRVEFFRHLPGILTGAGIVSTFAGILMGLTQFDPSVGADRVTHELQNLFMGVSTAFSASFFAIVTAMLVTVLEKMLLHWRYAQVLAFQGEMGRQFGMGTSDGGDSTRQQSSSRAMWEEPVQRVVDSLARLEPLLLRERDEREEATLSVALNLTSVMATVERTFEAWSARETQQREELRRWASEWNAFGRGVESLLSRQLAELGERAERDRESRIWLEGRLTALETQLARQSEREEGHEGRLESSLNRLGERLAELVERQLEAREGEDPTRQQQQQQVLGDSLTRLLEWLEEESRLRREESQGRASRLVALGERLEGVLAQQTSLAQQGAEQIGTALMEVSGGVVTLGSRLERQADRQLAVLQEEFAARRENFG